MPKKHNPNIRLHRRGRRIYGAFHRLPSGEEVYLAYRKTDQIFRSGHKTISDAIRDGSACWAIDEEDLINMRIAKIRYVGVFQRDTGDVYLSTMDAFMDRRLAKIMNYEGRGGSVQRYLPLKYFRRRKR